MAIVKLFLPKVGEGIMEATIIKWLKQEGDSIKEEESIVEVTTDKLEGNNSQLKVWSALTEIRYGRTSNYKQIAHNIKEPKAIRKVANTIGHNPLIIIVPCHRVIGSDGSLKGYSAGLGLKQVLLSMEKAKTACTSEF